MKGTLRRHYDKLYNQEEEISSRKKGRMTIDWSTLPTEILIRIIENHSLAVDDFTMLSCVCHAWHNATKICNWVKLRQIWIHHMPWLMLTDGNDECLAPQFIEVTYYKPGELENGQDNNFVLQGVEEAESVPEKLSRRNFLNLRLNKCYEFNCHQGYDRACWGSPYGWIVTTGLDHDMYMFNPLTKSRLDLPSRKTIPHLWNIKDEHVRREFITKIVVLKVPSTVDSHGDGAEELLVVVIYDSDRDRVVIAKPGDTRWMELDNSAVGFTWLMDALYHNDLGLVFLNQCGGLLYCKLWDKENPLLLKWYRPNLSYIVDNFTEEDFECANTYIVNRGNDLLMVLRILDSSMNELGDVKDDCPGIDGYKTIDFKIYKLDFYSKNWEELLDLQDVALFVGHNVTMCLRAVDAGCQRNCIYFTDDLRRAYRLPKAKRGGHDAGVFNLESRTIQLLSYNNMQSSYCCPLWFIPAL